MQFLISKKYEGQQQIITNVGNSTPSCPQSKLQLNGCFLLQLCKNKKVKILRYEVGRSDINTSGEVA